MTLPPAAGNLFGIEEGDSAGLGRGPPDLCGAFRADLDGRTRTQFRRCQTVASNIRRPHGPPTGIEVFPGTGADN